MRDIEVVPETLGGDVIEVRSMTNPKKVYRVDVVNGRCSCPEWIFQKGGQRKPCKHLKAMEFHHTLKSTKGIRDSALVRVRNED